MTKSKVYFTPDVSAASLVKIYDALQLTLPAKTAVKLHSGEQGNQNYLRPEYVQQLVQHVHGTVVECNTAYPGARDTTAKHRQLLSDHEWTKYFTVDLLDSDGPDLVLDIPDGQQIQQNFVGRHLADYHSLLVLSHFKGHAMGGFGGALKQLSIGCASSYGKKYIHGAGQPDGDYMATAQLPFVTAMGDAAASVHRYFQDRAAYVTAMVNISVDCDCDAHAAAPCMADIGLLSSTDPVALDQACVDLIYQSPDPGRDQLVARIEEKLGTHIIDVAATHGIGSQDYELIRLA